MTSSFFVKKFTALFIALMLVVPGFYTAVRTQKAMAVTVYCVNCYPISQSTPSLFDQFINTAKSIITSIQTTIIAVKTTYLALKEAVLDPIARLVSGLLSNSLVQMMFSFLGTGNNGAPAFVTNPQRFFESVAQESTNVFLTDLLNNRPQMMPSIRNAVRQRIIEEEYVDPQRMRRSTFPGGDAAYRAYLADPSKCPTGNSWDCYFATLEPQNDPFQVYLLERDTLAGKRRTDVRVAEDEFLAGSGYHSLKDCIERDATGGPATAADDYAAFTADLKAWMASHPVGAPGSGHYDPANTTPGCFTVECMSFREHWLTTHPGSDFNTMFARLSGDKTISSTTGPNGPVGSTVPGSASLGGGPRGGNCTAYLTKTPGAAISGQVDDYLNNALSLLQAADEIDEVITDGIGFVQSWMNGKGLARGSRNIDYSERNPDGTPRYVDI